MISDDARQYDCTVVGAGIVGMMSARELSERGLKVAVFDRGQAGMESSWAGGGILSPLYPWRENHRLQPLIRLSQDLYPALARQLQEATGIDPECLQSGLLVFGLDDSEMETALAWATRREQPYETPDAASLGKRVPSVNAGAGRALLLPTVSQIRNPYLSRALKRDLEKRGVPVFEHTPVNQINTAGDSVQSVSTSRGDFRTERVVTAMGAWNSDLLPALDIRPVRGQILCYQAPAGYITNILLDEGIYIIPRRDGHLLVGSTLEEVGFNKNTSEEASRRLSAHAARIIPAIKQFSLVKHWAGLRPATQSGLPYICAHPDIRGLYLNVGHYRNGILLAPGSARLLAEIILGHKTSIDCAEFALGVQRRQQNQYPEAVQ